MKIRNKKISKQFVFSFIGFIILFLSYTINLWQITPSEYFHGFERAPEGLVIGRLIKAEKDGIFSDGGLTGIAYTYNTDSFKTENDAVDRYRLLQHDIYLTNKAAPDNFFAYRSQTGGQGILYSSIQKTSPLSHRINLQLFRAINSSLTALCFMLFICWCYRNFGFISSFVTFILLLFSPWINNFSHNLWWSFWSFYLPFLSMLLLLEKRHRNPDGISEKKIFAILFLMVFVKCIFTGFEFITTTLLAIICPIVYYYVLEKRKFSSFIIFSLKTGLCAILAMIAEMVVLVIQIGSLTGNLTDGISHILLSYTRRTTNEIILDNQPALSYSEVLREYFGGNAFRLSFLESSNIQVHFGILVLLILIFGLFIILINKKLKNSDILKNRSLIITTAFSILCPLSWYIIFKQHSSEHPHFDYIVWYMPFLLYGFLVIGQGITLAYSALFKSDNSLKRTDS